MVKRRTEGWQRRTEQQTVVWVEVQQRVCDVAVTLSQQHRGRVYLFGEAGRGKRQVSCAYLLTGREGMAVNGRLPIGGSGKAVAMVVVVFTAADSNKLLAIYICWAKKR